MLDRISQVGAEITFADLFSGYRGIFINREADFKEALSGYLSSRYVYLLNSGTAAFYIILKVIKNISPKREVILPAYTAPAVVLPVLEAGLKPVLCDISLRDFNMDLDLLPEVISEDSLCVVPTHLFGIAVSGISGLKENLPGVFVIEDCAQSMGSKIEGNNAGNFGDISFLSFNRGKNLPTYGGGCIFSNSPELAQRIEIEIDRLREQNAFLKFTLPFKTTLFSLAIRPGVYNLFYPAISQFKDNRVPDNFSIGKYTNFQTNLGLSLLERIDAAAQKRYQNGTTLLNGLIGIKEIIVPFIPVDTKPAFNRFPVVFKDLKLREKVEGALREAGIDTSHMYLKPLHHIFNLGYKREEFLNAVYVAERLITLPTHPLVDEKTIKKIIGLMRKTLV